MIGLILGTSEGRKILSLLNEFTSDIFVSTATEYGGELLKEYKYAYMNNKPLDLHDLISELREKGVKVLVDASHPYAVEVTKNVIKACNELNIEYIRYERPSCIEEFKSEDKVVEVKDYDELKLKLKDINGTILNTTGSRSLDKVLGMGLNNRIIYRVLPSVKVINECYDKNIDLADIIALKGPISYELNCAFIKDYEAEAMLLKDSGREGGTYEKIRACLDCGIYAFIIGRKKMDYNNINVFYNVNELVKYIKTIKNL
ncbi:cobalt-precorrin-6A reductase [Clostridium coskatii]|uniref:Precorrin-6A reductase n=1 Tax=Clostridium coskatii TaxID=1705578 RepID=A0A166UB83_9CLOT|nr:cobalt-precorrin-6A reductase [Clostridium coskatii]OAA94761.1 Precorrin-6A reductase [Clostridium coskatii]OBR93333.1 precorrin-6A reductase [Clostridium coskatii]